MCGCLVALVALASPRLALFLIWIFSARVEIAFQNRLLLPLLGLIFLPWTTLFYVVAYAPVAGVTGIGWFFVVFGFLADLGSYFGGRYSQCGREGYSPFRR
ncbi:MAG TPA: hypothetical protein VIL12_02420 [Acidimicrobiia bacterium]